MNVFVFGGGRYSISPYSNSYLVYLGILTLIYGYIDGLLGIVVMVDGGSSLII